MILSFEVSVRVLRDPAELEPLLEDDAWSGPLAVEVEGRWILLGSSDLDRLRAAGAWENPRDALARWPGAPVASRGSEPPEPSLVLEDGRVVGAWVQAAEAVEADVAVGDDVAVGTDFTVEADVAVDGAVPIGTYAPGERTIRRTPHLDAPERIGKAAGTEFSVSVYTDTEERRPGEEGHDVVVTLPPGVETVDVGVLLQVTPHFEVLGKQYGDVTIAKDTTRSEPLGFKLRVAEEAHGEQAGIGVLFTHRGRSCGYVARAWDWAGEGPEAAAAQAETADVTTMPVHVDAERPDLSVYVTAPVKDGVNYLCSIDTPLIEDYTRATTSIAFAVPAQGYKFLGKLLDALVDGAKTPAQRLRALTEVGHEAFEAAPPIFAEVLWALVDAGKRPETIYVASSEPTLPWELMIPRRFDGKEPNKLGPLGTEFAIGRWTRGDSASPPPELPVASSFVVAPEYEAEHRRLDYGAEVAFIEGRLRGKRVMPATVSDLDTRFRTEHASLVHFVCHGAAGIEDDDAIYLDGDEQLRAREMETLAGFEELCAAAKPFVFLNSCSAGQTVPSLGGGSGFPRSFGNLGARAIVAPLWPVDDVLAKGVALEVYEAALAPDAPPVAAILRDLRKRGYQAGEVDSFAAYCFYGDPLARLSLIGA